MEHIGSILQGAMKIAHEGEWARTSMLSRRFRVAGICRECRCMTAGTVYHSIKTRETLCVPCYRALGDVMGSAAGRTA